MFGFLKYFSCARINTVYPDLTSINDDFSKHNIIYYLVRSDHNIAI
jgi:hypothetical protein